MYVPARRPRVIRNGDAEIPSESVRVVSLTPGIPRSVSPGISHSTETWGAAASPRRTRTRNGRATVARTVSDWPSPLFVGAFK